MAHLRPPSWGWKATLLASLALQAPRVWAVPSVDVGMTAAFAAPPYLTELLETAAQENTSSYFPLLDRIASGHFGQAKTDRDVYETFVALLQDDGLLSDADALSTFNWALSLRSAAPRVEAHFQFYRTAVNQSLDDGCDHWILWEGAQYCSPSLETPKTVVAEAEAQTKILPFDYTLGDGADAILYTDITDPGFGPFHVFLTDKARRGELSYRIRHVRKVADLGHEDSLERLPVSGYGVQLALKRTDYIVIDDRGEEDAVQSEATDTTALDDDVADVQPLSKSELAPLGLSVADFIARSADPLETLIKLTQDLPKYAHTIAAHNASPEFVAEHRLNRMQLVPAGTNVLWINGLQVPEWQMQPLGLLGAVRRERLLMRQIGDALGLTAHEIVDVLSHEAVAAAASKADDTSVRFDWRDNPLEQGRVIIWLNDLEKDSRYAEFPTGLKRLLQGGAPGQIPPVRRDIFNHVYAVDLTQPADAVLVVEQLQSFVRRRLPVRFGLVPLVHHDGAAAQAKVAYHLLETYGLSCLIAYLEKSLEKQALDSPSEAIFDSVTEDRELRPDATPMPLSAVLASDDYAEQIVLARHWARRLGAESSVPPIFVDGILVPRDENWLQAISARMGLNLRLVQEAVYHGHIDDSIWVPGFLLADAVPYRNTHVFPSDSNKLRIVDVTQLYRDHAALLDEMVPVVEADDDMGPEDWAVLTLVADLDSDDGLQLLFSALQFRRDHPGVHFEVVHNPAAAVASSDTTPTLRDRLAEILDVESWEVLKTRVALDTPVVDPAYLEAVVSFRNALGIDAGANVVVLNGRVVGPILTAAEFDTDAFSVLLQYEQTNRILPVYEAVADFGLTDRVVTSPLAAARLTATAAMSVQWSAQPQGIFEAPPSVRTSVFKIFQSNHTAFAAGTADEATATIHLTAVVNPASETGQRWAPLLRVLAQLDGVFLRIFLNPRDHLDELPVKRFYRAVGGPAPAFAADGHVTNHTAHFRGLPAEALLNLGMDVPPAWLVAPKVSVHDLDNIRLAAVRPATADVTATYELEHILVEGHSREVGQASRANYPPRGAQLVLRTAAGELVGDTIVMANLGYFQFKANPGSYRIELKQGRSADVYDLESVGAQGLTAVPGDAGADVTLVTFEGATLFPRLQRRAGMEDAEVMVEDKPAGAVAKAFSRLGNLLKGETEAPTTDVDVQADINVFSVASGHLYERMLNIMMVSVMKHTKHTVKFWFIEQFLSPSFKDFIPTLAAAYGFRYEMVTYKWPHWLRQQTEKQREIWGYKILFLDVLFPLSLDKVIFVDADQIVRTDLMDLVQTDLHGAPYGFTPMCDSRTEMEGFRFWKQGYWHKYLREGTVPYHISALYVVDLCRFRALGAGDRLRQTYHTLSADPNSLANLDQDLPNHMQFYIPIHSLDQDWLWCETWCSDEALKTARTIDLCNNPLTKEPKLDRARRQIPEWTAYDDEIAALARTRRRGQSMPMRPAEEEVKDEHARDEL